MGGAAAFVPLRRAKAAPPYHLWLDAAREGFYLEPRYLVSYEF